MPPEEKDARRIKSVEQDDGFIPTGAPEFARILAYWEIPMELAAPLCCIAWNMKSEKPADALAEIALVGLDHDGLCIVGTKIALEHLLDSQWAGLVESFCIPWHVLKELQASFHFLSKGDTPPPPVTLH